MKKIILVLIITLLAVSGAFGQVRLDLAIDVPRGAGLSTNTNDAFIDGTSEFFNKYIIPIPSAVLAYQFPFGPVKTGIGIKAYSFILESVAWPHAYAELDLSPIVINVGIGGGGFLLFGLYNHADTANLLIPDMHIAYKFGNTFRLGIGAMGFTGKDIPSKTVPYIIYLTGRFSILFDK